MRIGIFFGGRSREREISFAGGRTVYDLLDKALYTPVPVFIDSLGNFIQLDWQYLYKGSIRDFYPTSSLLQAKEAEFNTYIEGLGANAAEVDKAIAEVGRKIHPHEFSSLFDFAFLALHGPYGEDGSLQGLLEFYNIPYSGSGILPSAIGIDKHMQKSLLKNMGVKVAASITIPRQEWLDENDKAAEIFAKAKEIYKERVVIKSSTQGSSIGISILKAPDLASFRAAVDKAFFILNVRGSEWLELHEEERTRFLVRLCDIYEGTGLPFVTPEGELLRSPAELRAHLDNNISAGGDMVRLYSAMTEPAVVVEEFIEGKEFSCIVVEGMQGEKIALPPTEIVKTTDLFDYRAKYLPGISRKITPINLPEDVVKQIAAACEYLYGLLHFDVYARIDGIITANGEIYLNDPNTTSGMLPSSFFFHQAAEIGLSPSQFLNFIIYKSLQKRYQYSQHAFALGSLLQKFENKLITHLQKLDHKPTVAVILGGYSTERHISVESGRNVFEKLSSSGKYNVLPIFLGVQNNVWDFHQLPLNLLLKDNADDIAEKARKYYAPPVIAHIRDKASAITAKFASPNYEFEPKAITLGDLANIADFAFIGLHGRPGEDGSLQKELQRLGLPYNGSGSDSSQVTIDKFLTNEILRNNGFLIPEHYLLTRDNWDDNREDLLQELESLISYPMIAKPSDDGCSSAVKKIHNRAELVLFTKAMFRAEPILNVELRQELGLKPNEEFPNKDFFVVEEMVSRGDARYFLEITGGMLTSANESGEIDYEIFEPSEALAQQGILSLEEKFLAGEGQNITPARFAPTADDNRKVSAQVREQLLAAARVLNIEGYARIDAFVKIDSAMDAQLIFIEVNSLPGLTPATCIFHQAALNGYKPFEFLDRIIQYGIEKSRKSEHIQ